MADPDVSPEPGLEGWCRISPSGLREPLPALEFKTFICVYVSYHGHWMQFLFLSILFPCDTAVLFIADGNLISMNAYRGINVSPRFE